MSYKPKKNDALKAHDVTGKMIAAAVGPYAEKPTDVQKAGNQVAEGVRRIFEGVKKILMGLYAALKKMAYAAVKFSIEAEVERLTSVLEVTRKTVARNRLKRRIANLKRYAYRL